MFPKLTNTVVTVSTVYPGASSELIQGFITQPVQQAVAEADGIDFIMSTSVTGKSTIEANMRLGVDANAALADIQAKVSSKKRELPAEAEDPIIEAKVGDPTSLMYIAFYSETMSLPQITDFLVRVAQPQLQALKGVAKARPIGNKYYAARIWLNPEEMQAHNISTNEVMAALRRNNVLSSPGNLKGDNVRIDVSANTTINDINDFKDLVVVNQGDRLVRLSDVTRIELGTEDYDSMTLYRGIPSIFIGIEPAPGENPLDVAKRVHDLLPELEKQFPEGLSVALPYDASVFIQDSIDEVFGTIGEAVIIVLIVIFLTLGTFRAALIPALAVPLSLIGGAFLMLSMGFSINLLTLLAMVLAIGLVVDDAIVVVENVERVMAEEGLSPLEATRRSMGQIQGALVGIGLVLSAVFLPMAFFGGSTGVIYRQFSITIASAMILSVLVALIFTPALCATILKPVQKGHTQAERGFFGWFNRTFDRGVKRYEGSVASILQRKTPYLLLYVVIVALMAFLFTRLPSSFLPGEDQGVLFAQVQAPVGASAERTQQTVDAMRTYLLEQESDSVSSVFTVTGFNFAGRGQNAGLAFIGLKPWEERNDPDLSVFAVQQRAQQYFAGFRDAMVFAFAPPAVMELGTASGFNVYLQDNAGAGHDVLMQARNQLLGMASQSPVLANVRPNGQDDQPQFQLIIDDEKASALGLSLADINQTLSIAWGSSYVNDFIDRGRVKKVFLQGQADSRMNPEDLQKWFVRNSQGEMVPFSAFATGEWVYGSPKLSRYNGVPAMEIQGEPGPGYSTGDAMAEIERLGQQLPKGIGLSWTGLSFEERLSGDQAPALYALSLIVVFLCLAALYESWSIPLAVMLVVPLGVIGALLATLGRGLSNDVFFQVGLLTTIGLTAKNAILIVEFAKDLHEQGMSIGEAAVEACRLRLRPIIMTSLAFTLGVVPLALASGAGAGSSHAIGTGVIGGMITATVLAIFWVPLFYVLVTQWFTERKGKTDTAEDAQ